uniref:Uncharacterized protein n=1 Tax=Glossina austeni TaxID=7395 RepID=A0A1A9UMW2_GLOAU
MCQSAVRNFNLHNIWVNRKALATQADYAKSQPIKILLHTLQKNWKEDKITKLILVRSELKTDKNRRIHILAEDDTFVAGAVQIIEMRKDLRTDKETRSQKLNALHKIRDTVPILQFIHQQQFLNNNAYIGILYPYQFAYSDSMNLIGLKTILEMLTTCRFLYVNSENGIVPMGAAIAIYGVLGFLLKSRVGVKFYCKHQGFYRINIPDIPHHKYHRPELSAMQVIKWSKPIKKILYVQWNDHLQYAIEKEKINK